MNIDLSIFRDKAVFTMPIEGKIEGQVVDVGGRKINFLDPIEYNGEIYRVDGERLLYLNIAYRYSEACGRCLESFNQEEEITLTAKLVDKLDNDMIIEDDEDDNEDIIFYTGEELDLERYIINTAILSLPMKPLCNKDCKGLCPKCGADHNRTECDCIIEDIDPRFEKLKNFFPND